MVLKISVACISVNLFSLLYNIPWYGHTMFCLYIMLLVDIRVISSFPVLAIINKSRTQRTLAIYPLYTAGASRTESNSPEWGSEG